MCHRIYRKLFSHVGITIPLPPMWPDFCLCCGVCVWLNDNNNNDKKKTDGQSNRNKLIGTFDTKIGHTRTRNKIHTYNNPIFRKKVLLCKLGCACFFLCIDLFLFGDDSSSSSSNLWVGGAGSSSNSSEIWWRWWCFGFRCCEDTWWCRQGKSRRDYRRLIADVFVGNLDDFPVVDSFTKRKPAPTGVENWLPLTNQKSSVRGRKTGWGGRRITQHVFSPRDEW